VNESSECNKKKAQQQLKKILSIDVKVKREQREREKKSENKKKEKYKENEGKYEKMCMKKILNISLSKYRMIK
jgi:hypothetical protein